MEECPVEPAALEGWLTARGLGGLPLDPLPGDACVNWVAGVGPGHVVRVCKLPDEPDDCFTESVAVPAAVRAGLRTPRLLDFDSSLATLPAVVTLYERWPGVALGLTRLPGPALPGVYRELGRELGTLHSRVDEVDDPHGWLDLAEPPDPFAKLKEADLDAPTADWVEGCLRRLAPRVAPPERKAFVHNDAHAFNTLVLPDGRYSGLVDWGDAGWDDPAAEFATIPLFAADWCLEGYAETGPPVDEGFRARVLWHALDEALGREHSASAPHPWSIRPGTLWANVARLLAAPEAGTWRSLLA